MSAETLLALAERCENANGPDRELDELIAAAINDAVREVQPHGRAAYYHKSGSPWMYVKVPDPGYTASLDAAITLVPERFMWRLQSWPDGVNSAILEKNAGDFGAIDARHTESPAITPALALTASALRARATQGAAS